MSINIKLFTFRPLSIGSTHEIEPYIHIKYVGNNETDTRHVIYRDIPAEKKTFLFFPTVSIDTARNRGTAGK
jgi:hypothetical protein